MNTTALGNSSVRALVGASLQADDPLVLALGATAIVAVTLLAVAAVVMLRRRVRHRSELRERFGPEYDNVVAELGRRKGHTELERRLADFDGELELDRIPPDDRAGYTDRWREVQYRFVETPGWAIRESEHLVVDVMRDRGLPVDDMESRVRVLSVTDPDIASLYRDAYTTYRDSEDGEDDVARLHEAFVSYREVFEALLDRPQREASVLSADPPAAKREAAPDQSSAT